MKKRYYWYVVYAYELNKINGKQNGVGSIFIDTTNKWFHFKDVSKYIYIYISDNHLNGGKIVIHNFISITKKQWLEGIG